MSEGEWIKCPTCGWHGKKLHTGHRQLEMKQELSPKGEFTFLKGDLEKNAFISIRDLPGGKGNPNAFKEIERITLREAKDRPEYQELISSLRKKIEEIQDILRD